MNDHPVTFETLADWVDGRLGEEQGRVVADHLASGCNACRKDVAWLRRFRAAASLPAVEPPPALVARAKALYRARPKAAARRWLSLPRRWRLSPAAAALGLLLVLAAYWFVQAPAVLARGGLLAATQGTVEVAASAGPGWRVAAQGLALHEGARLRTPAAAATVDLFDGSCLDMQPGAEIQLARLRGGLFGRGRGAVVRQTSGTVFYDVPWSPGGLSRFTVQAADATVSTRGGAFTVKVTASGAEVAVFRGTVTVGGSTTNGNLSAGEGATIRAGEPLRRRQDGPPSATLEPSATPSPTAWPTTSSTPTSAARPRPTASPQALEDQGQGPRATQTTSPATVAPGAGEPGPGTPGELVGPSPTADGPGQGPTSQAPGEPSGQGPQGPASGAGGNGRSS